MNPAKYPEISSAVHYRNYYRHSQVQFNIYYQQNSYIQEAKIWCFSPVYLWQILKKIWRPRKSEDHIFGLQEFRRSYEESVNKFSRVRETDYKQYPDFLSVSFDDTEVIWQADIPYYTLKFRKQWPNPKDTLWLYRTPELQNMCSYCTGRNIYRKPPNFSHINSLLFRRTTESPVQISETPIHQYNSDNLVHFTPQNLYHQPCYWNQTLVQVMAWRRQGNKSSP